MPSDLRKQWWVKSMPLSTMPTMTPLPRRPGGPVCTIFGPGLDEAEIELAVHLTGALDSLHRRHGREIVDLAQPNGASDDVAGNRPDGEARRLEIGDIPAELDEDFDLGSGSPADA